MSEHYIIDDKEHIYESAAEKHLMKKTVTLNGTYKGEDESGDINGYSEVTVNVEGGGSATLITKSVTQNGTYTAQDDSADGYSSVTVNVDADENSVENFIIYRQASAAKYPRYVFKFSNTDMVTYYLAKNQTYHIPDEISDSNMKYLRKSYNPGQISKCSPRLDKDLVMIGDGTKDIQTVNEILESIPTASDSVELVCIYGNSKMISDMGLVLLCDAAGGGRDTVTLSDSLENYRAIALQGVYNSIRDSGYNTTVLYFNPELNVEYWAGMKDRNGSYTCNVTFTDNTTATLTGNKQVLIYGMLIR